MMQDMGEGRRISGIRTLLAGAAVLTLLGGCTYDYLNHSDRVTLAGGNAVRANIEMQTANPSRASSYDVRGLGRNGEQLPEPELTTTATTASPS